MDVNKRMLTIRILNQMEHKKELSERLGLEDISKSSIEKVNTESKERHKS